MTRHLALGLAAFAASLTTPAAALDSTLALGGEEIAVTVRAGGDAARPLILYCGGTGFTRARYGAAVIDALGEFGDVVVWDYPGQGDSSGRPDPFTAERVVGDMAGWLDGQGDRPVVVWGHSLGGFVGAQIAARSDAVDAVVLETTAPEPLEGLQAAGYAVPPEYAALAPLLSRYDIPAALAGFDGQTLVLGAGRDRVLPVRLSRKLADAVPGATYVENETATHFNSLAQPATREAVRELLEALE